MKNRNAAVNAWTQLSMDVPNTAVVSLLIGWVRDANHVQAQIEVRDQDTGLLLALWSRPHFELTAIDMAWPEIAAELLVQITEHAGPF